MSSYWELKQAERTRQRAEKRIVRDAKWDNERIQRRLDLDARKFAESTTNPKSAQPTSSKRREELQRTFGGIDHVVTPRQNPATTPLPNLTGVEFNVWKDGEMGTMKLAVTQDFEPLP